MAFLAQVARTVASLLERAEQAMFVLPRACPSMAAPEKRSAGGLVRPGLFR